MVATLAQTTETLRWLSTEPVARARIGQTPHAVIHQDRKACVRYFAPKEALHPPLFCVTPLINTWSVFDLLPGRSVVGSLVGAGVPVYVLDWGRAGREDQDLPMSHYVDNVLGRCLRRAARHAGVETIDVLGYCVGGTFLALHLARNAGPARRAYFLATPIDFHEGGRLCRWSRPENFPLDAIVNGFGNFPAALMQESFRWLRPMGAAAKWKAVMDRGHEPAFQELWAALERWNGDGVDFPGETYREYIRRCYMDNATMNGGWMMSGQPVDLARCTIPAMAVAASDDHIVPAAAAHALQRAWGGPVKTAVVRGGHVGVCAGSALPASILEWLGA